jgi:hypothetical protein
MLFLASSVRFQLDLTLGTPNKQGSEYEDFSSVSLVLLKLEDAAQMPP